MRRQWTRMGKGEEEEEETMALECVTILHENLNEKAPFPGGMKIRVHLIPDM